MKQSKFDIMSGLIKEKPIKLKNASLWDSIINETEIIQAAKINLYEKHKKFVPSKPYGKPNCYGFCLKCKFWNGIECVYKEKNND